MADIITTVNGMPKKDLVFDKPIGDEVSLADISAVKIKAIAKELVQPWKYGTALHRFARLHDVPIEIVRQINDAVDAKAATFAPVEMEK